MAFPTYLSKLRSQSLSDTFVFPEFTFDDVGLWRGVRSSHFQLARRFRRETALRTNGIKSGGLLDAGTAIRKSNICLFLLTPFGGFSTQSSTWSISLVRRFKTRCKRKRPRKKKKNLQVAAELQYVDATSRGVWFCSDRKEGVCRVRRIYWRRGVSVVPSFSPTSDVTTKLIRCELQNKGCVWKARWNLGVGAFLNQHRQSWRYGTSLIAKTKAESIARNTT